MRSSRLDAFRSLIGTVTDAEAALRIGCLCETVRHYRKARGIPLFRPPRRVQEKREKESSPHPVEAFAALLGTVPDSAIAKMAGCKTARVASFRNRRGIPALDPSHQAALAAVKDRMGVDPDPIVAGVVGCSPNAVAAYRAKHGIPVAKIPGLAARLATAGVGETTDTAVAKQVGCSETAVAYYRRKNGIPAAKIPGLAARLATAGVGEATDAAVAKQVGCSVTAVALYRRKNAIPPCRKPLPVPRRAALLRAAAEEREAVARYVESYCVGPIAQALAAEIRAGKHREATKPVS